MVVLSQVGADLFRCGILMEEEHHQICVSLMSGAHHSVVLVLSWLLTCVTAHWASPELSLEPHILPGPKSKSWKLLKPKPVSYQVCALSITLKPAFEALHWQECIFGSGAWSDNWLVFCDVYFFLGITWCAGSGYVTVWEFADWTLAPEVCIWCLCDPMAIVGVHHWVWSHTAVVHGRARLWSGLGGSKPLIFFIFCFVGVEGETTEFLFYCLVNISGS